LLLEGGDLPLLMARVRQECGPDARIVRAERVRSGGVAGFFAREHYELTVEVPVPRGIDALVDAADEDELALAGGAAGGGAGAAGAPGAPDEPRVSTDGAVFADVLDQVRALAGAVPGQGAGQPDGPGVEAGAALGLVDGVLGSAAGAGAGAAAPLAFRAATVPVVTGAARPPAPTAPSALLTALPSVAVPSLPFPSGGPVARSLRALGVPEHLLAHGPTLAGVLDAIEPAPAPHRGAGDVVALVGAVGAVERLVAVLALRWALEDAWVVRLGTLGRGTHRLPDADAVTRWRAKAAAAAHPWLVVVPVGPDAADRAAAAELLGAADPGTAWALVDARTRAGDVRRWLDDVGARRPADALAVDGVLDTAEPGSALDLGRPVALVDGVPAGRVAWAAVLGQDVDEARARGRGTHGSSG